MDQLTYFLEREPQRLKWFILSCLEILIMTSLSWKWAITQTCCDHQCCQELMDLWSALLGRGTNAGACRVWIPFSVSVWASPQSSLTSHLDQAQPPCEAPYSVKQACLVLFSCHWHDRYTMLVWCGIAWLYVTVTPMPLEEPLGHIQWWSNAN